MRRGGHSNARQASEEEIVVADAHKEEVEKTLEQKYTLFKVIEVTSQVVAGLNYKFNVEVDGGRVYMKIFKPLPHTGKPTQLSECEAKDGSFNL